MIVFRRLCFAFALSAALHQPAIAIVGASRQSGPLAAHLVMVLQSHGGRAGFCSGVVVAPRRVLTAAHCASDANTTRIHFRDANGAPVLMEVAGVARHPGFRADAVKARSRSVDLALVETREDLPPRYTPAPIAPGPEAMGAVLTVAGYGLSRETDPASGGVLREANVSLRAPLSSLLLWLEGNGAGACTGDSGGGVFSPEGALVGIIAFAEGAKGRGCGALTQAVRAAPFREWVEELR